MPSLSVEGAELHYQCLGPVDGKPVVMIHGLLLGNSATWYFGAASTLAKTHRVLVYDLRGHGLSTKARDGYELRTMVADLKALIDSQAFAHPRVALVGHSYGSLIALHFAKTYPDCVEKLSLVEGPLPPGRGLEIDNFLALSSEEQTRVLPDDLQAQLAKGSRQARKLLDRLQFLATETALIPNLRHEADVSDAELRDITVPVQLIYGGQSQLVDVAERLRENLPNAELSWLPGGHYLPSEKPNELSHLIGGFIP